MPTGTLKASQCPPRPYPISFWGGVGVVRVSVQARQQQAELAQQEWLQMQQAAQQAQMAAASAAQQAGSSQDEDEDEDM